MGARGVLGVAAALLALTVVAGAAPPAQSSASGVWDATERGCYCHGPLHSPAVGFSVEGLPGHYEPGRNYTVFINITFSDVPAATNASQGGFYLESSAGHFSVTPGWEDFVQVRDNESTQTKNGSRMRHWEVNWTAPDQPGLVISFFADANAVNGNKSESLGTDHWTYKTVRIGVGDAPEVIPPPAPQDSGALETAGFLVAGVAAGAVFAVMAWNIRRRAPP